MAIEDREHRRLDRRVVLFDLDVERHAGKLLQEPVEGGDADAPAAERVIARGVGEAVARVEAVDLGEREAGHAAPAVGGPVHARVVQHDDVPVGRGMHVELEPVRARGETGAERLDRVLRGDPRAAAMGE